MGRALLDPHTPRERVKRPTRRQQALAQAAADPSNTTIRAIARAAGYKDPGSAGESLRKPHVQQELARITSAKGTSALSILQNAKALIATGICEVPDSASSFEKVEIGAKAALSAAAILERVPSESAPDVPADPRALGRTILRGYLAGLSAAFPAIHPELRAPISLRIDRVAAYLSR